MNEIDTRSQPLVSVIMGIYNCSKTLQEAIESILAQTYTNWELIMCDDGSTDSTYSIANEYSKNDKRIVLIKNKVNKGLNVTLNHCLKYTKGKYIARMDGDDICVPSRFEKQVAFLEEHPEFAIVSSAMVFFDENGDWSVTSVIEKPTKEQIVTRSCISHPASMMRKNAIDSVNWYTVGARYIRVEDVDLWIKMYAKGYQCYNFPEPLHRMRNDRNAFSRRKYKYRINSTYVRLKGCKKMHLGIKAYMRSFSPMVIGLLPSALRKTIRRIIDQKGL